MTATLPTITTPKLPRRMILTVAGVAVAMSVVAVAPTVSRDEPAISGQNRANVAIDPTGLGAALAVQVPQG